MQAADGAGTDHDDRIALVDVGELLAVQHARKWLGDRRFRGLDVLGDAVDAIHRQDLGGNAHEFGESAVVVVADGFEVLAHGLEPAAALEAFAVRNSGDDLNAIAHAPRVNARPDLHDLAGDLVSHDAGQGDVGVAVVVDLDVGAARSAGKDADDQVTRARVRLGKWLEPEVTRRVQACCLDGLSPWTLGVALAMPAPGPRERRRAPSPLAAG